MLAFWLVTGAVWIVFGGYGMTSFKPDAPVAVQTALGALMLVVGIALLVRGPRLGVLRTDGRFLTIPGLIRDKRVDLREVRYAEVAVLRGSQAFYCLGLSCRDGSSKKVVGVTAPVWVRNPAKATATVQPVVDDVNAVIAAASG